MRTFDPDATVQTVNYGKKEDIPETIKNLSVHISKTYKGGKQ